MNLRTESRSSVLLIPLRGGTISIEGKGFLLSFSISLIFISLYCLFQCSCIRTAARGSAMINAAGAIGFRFDSAGSRSIKQPNHPQPLKLKQMTQQHLRHSLVHSPPGSVILELLPADMPYLRVAGRRMEEYESAYRGVRYHCVTLCE